MIDQKSELALAFLQAQPEAAASVLEQQPIAQVAAFLQGVPYKQSAAVLKKMLPVYTARLCAQVPPASAAAFLAELDISLVTTVLRHTSNETGSRILALLPERKKLACNLLLSYPETAVGAWMLTNYAALPDDCTIGEAKDRLAALESPVSVGSVCLVNRDRKVVGTVQLTRLLNSSEHKVLSSIADKKVEVISAWSSLSNVSTASVWQRTESLAVVNQGQQFIGVLRHLDLRNGLSEIARTIKRKSSKDPVSGLLEVYGGCLLALFGTVAEAANLGRARSVNDD